MTADPAGRPPDAVVRVPSEPHEHNWHLRSIDHSDGTTVREYECDSCGAVWFD